MPTIAEQIVSAATVKGRNDKLYCLGPFPKRVSFAAQQNRALNLVWALHECGKFGPNQRIAVIGAGLAGLTAAAAFIGHRCDVDVYESSAVTLPRQRATDHRMAHPTINQWPLEHLNPTTRFPFMEWYAATCDQVTKELSEQFDAIIKGTPNRVLTDYTVFRAVPVGTDLIELRTTPRIANNEPYHIVLIAIGFGQEKPQSPFSPPDYWASDNLERLRNLKNPPKFIVSGCGDGGLIDALRLAYLGFDKGRLSFEVAAKLSGTPLAKRIARGERAARTAGSPAGLGRVYTDAVELLMRQKKEEYKAAIKQLDDALFPGGTVYLLDEILNEPYSLYAAPIHKLMIAHADKRGAVSFERGKVETEDNKIKAAGLEFDPAPTETHVVIRHGARLDFGQLLTEDQRKDLEAKQTQLSDFHVEPQWNGKYPVPKAMPKYDLTSDDFISKRRPLAKRAMQWIASEGTFVDTKGAYRFEFEGKVPAHVPDQLFGVRLELEEIPDAKAIGG